jgi:hypothetical protein
MAGRKENLGKTIASRLIPSVSIKKRSSQKIVLHFNVKKERGFAKI